MEHQPDLFNTGKPNHRGVHETEPPHNGTDTSRDAARSIKPGAITLRARVFDYIEGMGLSGATDHEIVEALGMQLQTVNPRRNELVNLGLIVDSGDRRKTPSGRKAKVWKVIN